MENAPFAGKSISSPPILEPMSWGNNSRESEVKPFQVDVAILEEKMKVKLKDPDGMKHIAKDNRMQTVYSRKIYPQVSNYLTLLNLCDS